MRGATPDARVALDIYQQLAANGVAEGDAILLAVRVREELRRDHRPTVLHVVEMMDFTGTMQQVVAREVPPGRVARFTFDIASFHRAAIQVIDAELAVDQCVDWQGTPI
jgi:uncharacterized protein YoaH (UPF0181 family)